MQLAFINSFSSEWLKKKRTASSWLVIIGGLFIPAIMLIARFVNSDKLYAEVIQPRFWEKQVNQSWQFMAIFLLPMGVILASSLITQLEYRNNTWKQLHATPQSFPVIYFTKLSLILVMLLQFFLLFNVGIIITALLPSLVLSGVPMPYEAFPVLYLLKVSGYFFICCLPIVGLQYLLSLHFKNFLLPLGAGIGLLVASLIAVQWKYGYTFRYTF
jgi:lantibiotic transport system permease protein